MDEVTKAIDHFSVLMEQQNAKLDAVLEGVGAIREKVDSLATKEQLEELTSNVEVIRAAVTATNSDLAEHKHLPANVAHGSGDMSANPIGRLRRRSI